MYVHLCTFMIISRSVLLRMKNVSVKSGGRENQNTHFRFQNVFLENPSVSEIMRKKYYRAWQATDDNIIGRRRIACWIPNATNPHSGCVILITFPLRQW